MLKSHLKKIYEIANQGDAREESYYSILEGLLKGYIESVGKRNIHITTLPKKTETGNPDFRIWDGKQHIVGYIEAKAPTVDNLDLIEDSKQLKRYRQTFCWQYQIGGYQVCGKWLKDRKGRTLSLDDIKHYCRVVTALQKTIEIQKALDDIYPEVEKETVKFER